MRRPAVMLFAVICLIITVWDNTYGIYSYESIYDSGVRVCGTVSEIEKKDDNYYVLKLTETSLDGEKRRPGTLLRLYCNVDNYRELLWTTIETDASVCVPQTASNPNCFDYRRNLMSQGIDILAQSESYKLISDCNGIFYIIRNVKNRAITTFEKYLSEESASLMQGMLFGESSYMDEELLQMFRRGGTAHILAVSGLHMGIIYSFLSRLKRKKRDLPKDICIIAFIIFYMALASFSPSVTRASLMIIFHIVSFHVNGRYDLLSSASAAGICILILKPYELFNPGFQMSFLAVLSIAFFMPVLKKHIKGMLCVMFAVQIGIAPVTVYLFNYFSLTSVISNIPMIFLASLVIPMGVAVIFLPVAAPFILPVTEGVLKILVETNRITYMDGIFTFDVPSPSKHMIFLVYLALFFISSELFRIMIMRKRYKKAAAFIAAVAVIVLIAVPGSDNRFKNADFIFVDVGQGDCLHVRCEGKNILIDGGGRYNYNVGEKILKPYLLKNGVTDIDLALVTHLHMDHYKGICELSQTFDVKKIGVYEANMLIEEDIKKKTGCDNIMYLKTGSRIRISDSVVIDILAPDGKTMDEYRQTLLNEEDENASSLIIRISCRGKSVLMTGDIDTKGENSLRNKDIDIDILKVAHHGSRYSTGDVFINRTSPETAVIQVGKNNYGHPSDEVIAGLEEKNIPVYRTDESGAIGIRVHRDKTVIYTARDPA